MFPFQYSFAGPGDQCSCGAQPRERVQGGWPGRSQQSLSGSYQYSQEQGPLFFAFEDSQACDYGQGGRHGPGAPGCTCGMSSPFGRDHACGRRPRRVSQPDTWSGWKPGFEPQPTREQPRGGIILPVGWPGVLPQEILPQGPPIRDPIIDTRDPVQKTRDRRSSIQSGSSIQQTQTGHSTSRNTSRGPTQEPSSRYPSTSRGRTRPESLPPAPAATKKKAPVREGPDTMYEGATLPPPLTGPIKFNGAKTIQHGSKR